MWYQPFASQLEQHTLKQRMSETKNDSQLAYEYTISLPTASFFIALLSSLVVVNWQCLIPSDKSVAICTSYTLQTWEVAPDLASASRRPCFAHKSAGTSSRTPVRRQGGSWRKPKIPAVKLNELSCTPVPYLSFCTTHQRSRKILSKCPSQTHFVMEK